MLSPVKPEIDATKRDYQPLLAANGFQPNLAPSHMSLAVKMAAIGSMEAATS